MKISRIHTAWLLALLACASPAIATSAESVPAAQPGPANRATDSATPATLATPAEPSRATAAPSPAPAPGEAAPAPPAARGTIFTLWPLIDYRTSPAEGFSNLSILGP